MEVRQLVASHIFIMPRFAFRRRVEVFGSRWIALFSAVLTLAILVLSEILPKTLGATFWQSLAPVSARVLRWMILEVMNNVMNLEYVTVGQVMTPRTQRAFE
jgi:Mg2+/Co2+ transporter CorB